jgi:hypothetical protein
MDSQAGAPLDLLWIAKMPARDGVKPAFSFLVGLDAEAPVGIPIRTASG